MLSDAGIEVGIRISNESKSEENVKEDKDINEIKNENRNENKHNNNNTSDHFDYNDEEDNEGYINSTNTNHNNTNTHHSCDHIMTIGTLGELRVSTVDAFQVKTSLYKMDTSFITVAIFFFCFLYFMFSVKFLYIHITYIYLFMYSNYATCMSQGCEMDIIIVCISKKTGSSFLRYVRTSIRTYSFFINLDDHCLVIRILIFLEVLFFQFVFVTSSFFCFFHFDFLFVIISILYKFLEIYTIPSKLNFFYNLIFNIFATVMLPGSMLPFLVQEII